MILPLPLLGATPNATGACNTCARAVTARCCRRAAVATQRAFISLSCHSFSICLHFNVRTHSAAEALPPALAVLLALAQAAHAELAPDELAAAAAAAGAATAPWASGGAGAASAGAGQSGQSTAPAGAAAVASTGGHASHSSSCRSSSSGAGDAGGGGGGVRKGGKGSGRGRSTGGGARGGGGGMGSAGGSRFDVLEALCAGEEGGEDEGGGTAGAGAAGAGEGGAGAGGEEAGQGACTYCFNTGCALSAGIAPTARWLAA